MLLGMLPTGELRIRPEIVIVQGEFAGMGAPVGDSLRPPTFLIAKYSAVSPLVIVSRCELLTLDLKVKEADCVRKKPFGNHSTIALPQESEVATNTVLGVNFIVTAAEAANARSELAIVTETCDNVVADD